MATLTRDDAAKAAQSLKHELGKVIVGQAQVVEETLIALAANGHVLLEGVPGLAKTLLISTLAAATRLSFSRVQFTPDLMPADITGTEIIREDKSTGQRELAFLPGPIFASVILADEINRTPPKTQAALLEAMQERQVTAGGQRRKLPNPFFVLATQNPIEQEGTYNLPEAQLDRFLLKIVVGYPSEAEELEIIARTTGNRSAQPDALMDGEQLLALQHLVRETPAADGVVRYALALVRATRPVADGGNGEISPLLRWGAG
ncbi:MAG: AAA family ATPase, partial [Planctomycetes bacterium]|nr:AAA family ATPase [Planctomycetota bacterium]